MGASEARSAAIASFGRNDIAECWTPVRRRTYWRSSRWSGWRG